MDVFCWLTQWNPGHWVDKVFAKFNDSDVVNQLLKRTALYHWSVVWSWEDVWRRWWRTTEAQLYKEKQP